MLIDLLRVSRDERHQNNAPACFQMTKASPRSPRHEPFVVAQVFVCKLLKQGPFHHLLGSVVLQEVNEDVLQPGIVLRGRGLFGKQVEPRVLLVERLPTKHAYQHVRSSARGNATAAETKLKPVLWQRDSRGRYLASAAGLPSRGEWQPTNPWSYARKAPAPRPTTRVKRALSGSARVSPRLGAESCLGQLWSSSGRCRGCKNRLRYALNCSKVQEQLVI